MEIYEDKFNPSFLEKDKSVLTPLPADAEVAMAYIPFQQKPAVYAEEETALKNGTAFPELNKATSGTNTTALNGRTSCPPAVGGP